MSLRTVYYSAVFCRIASIFSLGMFFYSYWAGLENRVLILCIGISLTGWLTSRGFHHYFEQAVTRIAIAKHIAQANVIEEVVKEDDKPGVKHPLFTNEEKDEDNV